MVLPYWAHVTPTFDFSYLVTCPKTIEKHVSLLKVPVLRRARRVIMICTDVLSYMGHTITLRLLEDCRHAATRVGSSCWGKRTCIIVMMHKMVVVLMYSASVIHFICLPSTFVSRHAILVQLATESSALAYVRFNNPVSAYNNDVLCLTIV